MSPTVLNVVGLAFMLVVVLVLITGLWNLVRGGSPERSNKLMQARIVFQLIAVALVMLALWLARS